MHIQGYFQSEKYFDSSLVRNMFKIDNETQDFLKEKYDEILELPGITSINVRRGDYLKVQDHLPVCSLNYYNKAIEIIGKDKPYLITSDDLEWCRQNFKGDKFYFAECTNPTYDLYLPSMCQNHIISNSTFSWWGAWLNNSEDKKVIAPLRWFGPKYAEHNTQDLLPEKWIKI
ncbi:MAG: alpha-1,2-fucosyltransferase [Tannerellaceae bacterium]|nr:alpha-1,2-fucosyltransferase [Tannerellaceae bacterium]